LVLASDDLDETREQIARIYKPHDLAVIGSHQRVRARMHHRALGPSVSLNRLAHGAAVRIDPDRLDDFFLVQMPLAGEAAVWHQNAQHHCAAGQATVISPQDAVRMEWSGNCDQFMLRIDRQCSPVASTRRRACTPRCWKTMCWPCCCAWLGRRPR